MVRLNSADGVVPGQAGRSTTLPTLRRRAPAPFSGLPTPESDDASGHPPRRPPAAIRRPPPPRPRPGLPPGRDRSRSRPSWPSCASVPHARARSGPRPPAGAPPPRRDRGGRRGRGVHARLQPRHARGRDADVLAEALLRVPDAETQDRLIRDKIEDVDWLRRVARSESFLINASAFGLMLSGRVVGWDRPGEEVTTRLGRSSRAGRARGARGDAAGDAAHGPAVRAGPDDRAGDRARARDAGAGLPLLLRHAGRGGADRGRRGALPGLLPGVAGAHRGECHARAPAARPAEPVDQALRAPPALRAREVAPAG
jgi:hypothetical protein